MHKDKFILEKVKSKDDWNALLNQSLQSTIFFQIEYLNLIGNKYHLWFIKQGNEIKAGICLIVSDNEKEVIQNDFIIYSGLIFKNFIDIKIAKKRHKEFQITEFAIQELTRRYSNLTFCLSPYCQDIRPFQWHNYNCADKKKFSIDIKYTSILDISEFRKNRFVEDESNIFLNLESVRRYSIREANKDVAKVIQSNSKNILLKFYEKMMIKNNINISKNKIHYMSQIISSYININKGALFHVCDSNDNILYAVFYIWDNNYSYYLFGAGSDEKTSWQASIINWEVFKFLSINKKINYVDLEGVNSPKRGWFKLGFGGTLQSYYKLVY